MSGAEATREFYDEGLQLEDLLPAASIRLLLRLKER